jgi:type VI protein secretion system component VasA
MPNTVLPRCGNCCACTFRKPMRRSTGRSTGCARSVPKASCAACRWAARSHSAEGVRIDLEVDDLAFQGGSPFLLGCVLERYFARHVSMNGFTETRLRSPARGEILIGKPMMGVRPTL